MAQSPQHNGGNQSPPVAWLLCAACGPLSEELVSLAGVSLEGVPGIVYTRRRYAATAAVPLPQLRQWVAEDAAAQEAVERVEAARSRERGRQRPLTPEEVAARARAALVLGKGREFVRHYKRYTQEPTYDWHPDPDHYLFWDMVLGPGWQGADAVPGGEARREIALLAATAHAFFRIPPGSIQGKGLCGAPEHEEWLEVAAALRVADADSLDSLMFDGSKAALAAQELLIGAFSESQSEFERLFGRAVDSRYAMLNKHALPLLTYALVGGVFAGASPRFLQTWFDYARFMTQYAFSPLMAREQQEMMRFIDHLEQVDELMNRNGSTEAEPEFNGALSCLPFAMTYRALPGSVRQHLNADALAEAVETLAERDGLLLLARYGAAGLRKAASLSPARRKALEALLAEAEEPFLPQLKAPSSERALEALRRVAETPVLWGSSLRGMRWAQPPTLCASRTATGVCIDMADEEYLSQWDDTRALRCMKKYASNGQLLLEGASPAEFTRLFHALASQVDVGGSLAQEGEELAEAAPSPVLLLSHEGGGQCLAAVRLRLLPGTSLLMIPGAGPMVPVLETEDGRSVPVLRHRAAEYALAERITDTLLRAGCENAAELLNGGMSVEGFEKLAYLLRVCRENKLEICWEKGHALRLHQPRGGLFLQRRGERADWLELGGGLPVDEGRVLELTALLQAFPAREGNMLSLEGGDYVQLSPELERQLALLELVWQEKRGQQGVSPIALHMLEALEDERITPSAALPEGLQATLRPYQEQGYCWLVERAAMGFGALLADDMGLGKTVQVLALLLHAAQQSGAGPALVVAPVSLLGNWAAEAARFAPALRVITFEPGKPEMLAGLAAGALVLASYGQIASRQAEFAAVAWDVLVLDEAQAIKNPDSQRARAVCTLRARARFCLTGTPVENSLLDLWSQIRFLNPGLLGTRAAFLRRFKKATPKTFALLRQVLAPLVLRRTKAQVLEQLPALTETVEWVEFSREERALYESLRREAVKKLGQGSAETAAGMGLLAELTRLRRACCHGRLALASFAGDSAKLAALTGRVEELRAAGRRALVFSQFTDVLDLAQEALQGVGISCLRLDGSTPAKKRTELVSDFQKGRADAFLISLKAGGAGLNLTAADYVILLDPWWNPAVEAQAAGRSHRMGQTQPVTLCRIMVRDTVEERIADMQRDKKELAEQVLSGKTEGMSLAHLRELLGAPLSGAQVRGKSRPSATR